MRRESDEEDASVSDAGGELAADEIKGSDDSSVQDLEAPSRKRKAPQTALKVRVPRCLHHWGPLTSTQEALSWQPHPCPIIEIPFRAVPVTLDQ